MIQLLLEIRSMGFTCFKTMTVVLSYYDYAREVFKFIMNAFAVNVLRVH